MHFHIQFCQTKLQFGTTLCAHRDVFGGGENYWFTFGERLFFRSERKEIFRLIEFDLYDDYLPRLKRGERQWRGW